MPRALGENIRIILKITKGMQVEEFDKRKYTCPTHIIGISTSNFFQML